MNTDYWNKFYSDVMNTNPSTFASFCLSYISPNDSLIDIGCGDGRDSIFFAQRLKHVVSIDNSSKTIDNLQKTNKLSNNEFYNLDIESLQLFNQSMNKQFDVIYCRFLLHAIAEDREDILLNWAYKTLPIGGRIMIETRTTEDEKLPKHYDNHYRRYIDTNVLCHKLESLKFKIIHHEEGTGLSPFKAEDPYLARIVAEK